MVRPKDVIQNRRYLKDDLAPDIVQRMVEDCVNFEGVGGLYNFKEALYSSINKEPMKRAYWGQFNVNPAREIIQEVSPWAAFYFYAGVWAKKSTRLPHIKFFRRTLSNQNIYKVVYDCVEEGIRTIKRHHDKLYQKGNYKHPFKVPHLKEIKEIMPKPKYPHYSSQLTLGI